MEEKELKSMRLSLDYPTENGEYTTKELTVKITTPKPNKQYAKGFRDHFLTYELFFSLDIPEFIHAELKGKSVGQKKLGVFGGGDARSYDAKFPKSIKAGTLAYLTEAWVQIVIDYIWLKELEKAKLTKVIFHNFDNGSNATQSTWNGLKLGHKAELKYTFAIGYISTTKHGTNRYNSDKKLVNSFQDKLFYELKYITWTQAREEFFFGLRNAFDRQIAAMAEFEKELNEEGINAFIANKSIFLSLGGGDK